MRYHATKFVPAQAAFQNAVAAGFGCAELWTSAQVLAAWETVAEEALQHPLKYTLHFPNRKDLPADTCAHAVALYRRLGCRAMVIHEPQWAMYGDQLRRLMPEICLAVENHYVAPRDLHAWGERYEFLTLDFEHLWKFTLSDAPSAEYIRIADQFVHSFAHKLRHVHLPGYMPGAEEHRPMYCARDMTFAAWNILEAIDFQGFVVSEADVQYQNQHELRMDVLLFEAWKQQRQSPVLSNRPD